MKNKAINTKAFFNIEIPSDWEVKNFEDVADIDKESLSGSTSKDYEFDYISLSDVDSDDFKIETTRQVFATAPSRARRIVKEGDILMSTVRPNLLGFSLIRNEVKDLIASTGFAVITANKCINEFLFQYLFSSGIERQFYQLLVGSNYPAINSSDVRKLKIPLPPLSEQKAIAQVLCTADAAIHTTEKLITQKELRKKWLMQQLLTGKKRLSAFPSSGKKRFGGEWKKCTAFDFFSQRNEQAPNNGNIPLFSLTIENGVTEKSDRYEREFLVKDKSIKNYKIVYPNDIVFNPANLRWGAIAKHTRTCKVLLSPIYEVLSVKKNFDIDFISYLVSSPRQIAYYASILEGTLIERMAVKVEPFLATKYEIPDQEEQSAIAQVLQAADKEISLLKAKAEKLREQKKGLMQVLLTGKVRLKVNDI